MIDARGVPADRWAGKRIHFVGIGGVGMGALARVLNARGAAVSGSDRGMGGVADLVALGIPVASGHSPGNVPPECDLVVATAAVAQDNAELQEARRRGVPVCKYAQLLGEVSGERHCVAISGVHGKTTTTSMVAYALVQSGLDPSVVVGGRVRQIGGSGRAGQGPHFVVEACEYDRSFLQLRPRCAVINNIEAEHMDFYRDLDDLVQSFAGLAENVHPEGVLIVNGDDPNALAAAASARCRMETFGTGEMCDWRLLSPVRANGSSVFRVAHNSRDLGEFRLNLPGEHNALNAVACLAACHAAGAPLEPVRRALSDFQGADRRLQEIGRSGGVRIFDDYAHHPTEIRATLAAAREAFGKARLWCVFQPHQCSRTRLLLDEFGAAFGLADRVIVPDIYSVRDTEEDRRSVHSRDLVERIRSHGPVADYEAAFEGVVERLAAAVQSGDLVLTMGAGPVDEVARSLARRLEKTKNVAAA